MYFRVGAASLFAVAVASSLSAQTPQLGVIQFPTSATGKAQEQFITGVLYLHSFEYALAAAAFQRAERIEPDFVMAYWGEAMTYTHPVWNQQDVAAGRAALGRLAPTPAARGARARTARERDYLDAVEVLYADGSKPARDTAYSRRMQQLASTYPTDAEAQAFYALSLLGLSQSAREIPTYMRAGAIAESLFDAHPRHPGAAHYVIHAFDDPVHAPLGLRAARAYSSIAPDAAHAQHMTSHIFLALGMWDETVHANEVATVATRDTTTKWSRWSCGHYGEWLQYAYLQQGRPGAAAQLLDECRQQAPADPGPRTQRSLVVMRAQQIVDGGDWNGPAAHMDIDISKQPAGAQLLLHFGTGYAAVRRGDTAAVRAVIETLSNSAATPVGDGYHRICALELQALLALKTGHAEQSLPTLRRAVAIEDSLPVDFGPPIDIKPPRELLAEALLQLGHAADAQTELEHQLARTPRRAATLLALAQAATAAGKTAVAEAANADLARVWHSAEPNVATSLRARKQPN
jgi:tetratricopeptide (TPR) repeat protein